MKYYVHPGTGTYMAEVETQIIDLGAWAADSGFTQVSEDLYVNDDTGHQYTEWDLIAYYLEVTT